MLGAADIGQPISCRVKADGLTTSTSAALTVRAPQQPGGPSVDGDPRLGRTLTCDPGGWTTPTPSAYRWLRGGPRSPARPRRPALSSPPT